MSLTCGYLNREMPRSYTLAGGEREGSNKCGEWLQSCPCCPGQEGSAGRREGDAQGSIDKRVMLKQAAADAATTLCPA